jgi:hypothetical protein
VLGFLVIVNVVLLDDPASLVYAYPLPNPQGLNLPEDYLGVDQYPCAD